LRHRRRPTPRKPRRRPLRNPAPGDDPTFDGDGVIVDHRAQRDDRGRHQGDGKILAVVSDVVRYDDTER
jgi:hypothetical protein